MLLCMPDILAIWEVIFDWFSKHNVSSILIYKIFSIYIFSTVVVQYFTRGEDRDDPFWHTGTGWQQDHSQDDFWLIELQFPFRCSHLPPPALPLQTNLNSGETDKHLEWRFGICLQRIEALNLTFLSSIPAPMSRFFTGHHLSVLLTITVTTGGLSSEGFSDK